MPPSSSNPRPNLMPAPNKTASGPDECGVIASSRVSLLRIELSLREEVLLNIPYNFAKLLAVPWPFAEGISASLQSSELGKSIPSSSLL